LRRCGRYGSSNVDFSLLAAEDDANRASRVAKNLIYCIVRDLGNAIITGRYAARKAGWIVPHSFP
jgi:hypothetical protein